MLLDELDTYPSFRQPLHEGTKVIQVAGKPVHTVHHDYIPVTGEPKQFCQLRPRSFPAGSFVSKDSIQNLPLELTFLVLIKGADPDVTDTLTNHARPPTLSCVELSKHPGGASRVSSATKDTLSTCDYVSFGRGGNRSQMIHLMQYAALSFT